MSERVLCAWSVRAVLFFGKINVLSNNRCRKQTPTREESASKTTTEGKIYVYRKYFEVLLAHPKPLRDQLIIELPTLEGLRSGEVSNQRIELTDLAHGLLHVLDSKKRTLRIVPLNPTVAKHIASHIQTIQKSCGFLIGPNPKAKHTRKPNSTTAGEGLSITHIDYVWGQHCKDSGIPYMPARMGRAHFATVWHFVKHKSIHHLKAILGHEDIQSTEHYLSRIVDVQDMINEFHEDEEGLVQTECTRFSLCPHACPKCYCHDFMPKIEVQTP